MRSVLLQVCQRLMVVSYCMPGSPHCQADSAILASRSRARNLFRGSAVVDVAGPPITIVLGGLHEFLGDPDGVVGVLEKDRAVSFAVDGRVITLLDEDVGLALFFVFWIDEFDDIGVIDVQDYHLGGATSLAAALDYAGEGVETLHEADRAGGDAAAGKRFLAAAKRGEIGSGTGTPLKEHAFGRARPMIDSMSSWTELMKQAEHCGLA